MWGQGGAETTGVVCTLWEHLSRLADGHRQESTAENRLLPDALTTGQGTLPRDNSVAFAGCQVPWWAGVAGVNVLSAAAAWGEIQG